MQNSVPGKWRHENRLAFFEGLLSLIFPEHFHETTAHTSQFLVDVPKRGSLGLHQGVWDLVKDQMWNGAWQHHTAYKTVRSTPNHCFIASAPIMVKTLLAAETVSVSTWLAMSKCLALLSPAGSWSRALSCCYWLVALISTRWILKAENVSWFRNCFPKFPERRCRSWQYKSRQDN
jgi:hypothetical protein